MSKRRNKFSGIFTSLLTCIGVMIMNNLYAREGSLMQEANDRGYGLYLTISAAILLTFLTYYGITLLARFIRETSADSFQGFEDSDV